MKPIRAIIFKPKICKGLPLRFMTNNTLIITNRIMIRINNQLSNHMLVYNQKIIEYQQIEIAIEFYYKVYAQDYVIYIMLIENDLIKLLESDDKIVTNMGCNMILRSKNKKRIEIKSFHQLLNIIFN